MPPPGPAQLASASPQCRWTRTPGARRQRARGRGGCRRGPAGAAWVCPPPALPPANQAPPSPACPRRAGCRRGTPGAPAVQGGAPRRPQQHLRVRAQRAVASSLGCEQFRRAVPLFQAPRLAVDRKWNDYGRHSPANLTLLLLDRGTRSPAPLGSCGSPRPTLQGLVREAAAGTAVHLATCWPSEDVHAAEPDRGVRAECE